MRYRRKSDGVEFGVIEGSRTQLEMEAYPDHFEPVDETDAAEAEAKGEVNFARLSGAQVIAHLHDYPDDLEAAWQAEQERKAGPRKDVAQFVADLEALAEANRLEASSTQAAEEE